MSSFRKRHVLQKPVPGTRTSPQTGQVQTSSGNPSLDVILGGGLPIGSICLIEEDKHITYSKVLAKYFLAEGVISQQSVFLGSLDDDPSQLLAKLPKPLDEEEIEKELAVEENNSENSRNGLRIAWRYNDLPVVNSEQATAKIGHHFNLMEQMDPLFLCYVEKVLWDGSSKNAEKETGDNSDEEERLAGLDTTSSESDSKETTDLDIQKLEDPAKTPTPSLPSVGTKKSKIFEGGKYQRIMKKIHALLREDEYVPGSMGSKNLCRVCITSLGSPLWYDEQFSKDILKFLTVLRAAIRNSLSVCLITMPMHLVAQYDSELVPKIRNLVDFSIELESFAGSEYETNPAFKEFSGLFHLRKISAVNALCAYLPETTDLAFKLKRKKFIIEKLHLPPELQETSGDASGDTNPTISCGTLTNPNTNASLDF